MENDFEGLLGNKPETLAKATLEPVIADFEKAFIAGFMHYRKSPEERFPGAVRMLYDALFLPDDLRTTLFPQGAEPDSRAEQRFNELSAISPYAVSGSDAAAIPTREEFERALRLSLRHGSEVALTPDSTGNVDYNHQGIPTFEQALYPDVSQAIQKIWDSFDASILIWTSGDASAWQGQLYKVAQALGPQRREQNFGSEKTDRLRVVSDNEKLSKVEELLRSLEEQGKEMIVVVEDRLAHLQKAKKVAEENTILCIPVWVRREGNEFSDIYPEQEISDEAKVKYQQDFNAVSSFAEVQTLLQEKYNLKPGQSLGMILDYDGVLNDDAQSRHIWATSIVRTLLKNQWIQYEAK